MAFLFLSFEFAISFPLSFPPFSLYWYSFTSGLAQGVENRSWSKHGRAHLHDMNIMERAGSSVNSGYTTRERYLLNEESGYHR